MLPSGSLDLNPTPADEENMFICLLLYLPWRFIYRIAVRTDTIHHIAIRPKEEILHTPPFGSASGLISACRIPTLELAAAL